MSLMRAGNKKRGSLSYERTTHCVMLVVELRLHVLFVELMHVEIRVQQSKEVSHRRETCGQVGNDSMALERYGDTDLLL